MASDVEALARAAAGTGITPWAVDGVALHSLATGIALMDPAGMRDLSVRECGELAHHFRDRVLARQARESERTGHRSCPFDLYRLLPVPPAVLRLGGDHPDAVAWKLQHWGVEDEPRQAETLDDPRPPRRLAAGMTTIGWRIVTAEPTIDALLGCLAPAYPAVTIAAQRIDWT